MINLISLLKERGLLFVFRVPAATFSAYIVTFARSCSGVHITSTVDMIVNLCRITYHSSIDEGGECSGFHGLSADLAINIGLPKHLQQYHCYDRVYIDTVNIAADTIFGQGLD